MWQSCTPSCPRIRWVDCNITCPSTQQSFVLRTSAAKKRKLQRKLYWLGKLCTNYQLLKPPSRAYEMIRAIRVLWPMWPCPSRRFNRPAFRIQKVAIGPKMLLRKVSRQHISQPLFARNPEKSHAIATCKYLSDTPSTGTGSQITATNKSAKMSQVILQKTAKKHPVKSTFNQPPGKQNYTNLS